MLLWYIAPCHAIVSKFAPIQNYFLSKYNIILLTLAGADVLKCPITCEVMKDPVVAAGIHINRSEKITSQAHLMQLLSA